MDQKTEKQEQEGFDRILRDCLATVVKPRIEKALERSRRSPASRQERVTLEACLLRLADSVEEF